jgi:hypothetical protein
VQGLESARLSDRVLTTEKERGLTADRVDEVLDLEPV